MVNLLFVAVGGAAGSVARYLVGGWTLRALGPGWPYGTFAVNLVGGFLMGLLVGWLAHQGGAEQERLRVLLGVGVLGGFTTFSAFSLETARMIETRAFGQAAVYTTLSVVLSVGALFAGLILARRAFA
jgi:CrcB protein